MKYRSLSNRLATSAILRIPLQPLDKINHTNELHVKLNSYTGRSLYFFTPSLKLDWPRPRNLPSWSPWGKDKTQRCPRSRRQAAPAQVKGFLKNKERYEVTEQEGTHIGHVTDCGELAGGSQVEAVHLVLHTARYFTIATAEVCHHQRRRSATDHTKQVFNRNHLKPVQGWASQEKFVLSAQTADVSKSLSSQQQNEASIKVTPTKLLPGLLLSESLQLSDILRLFFTAAVWGC